ncbi:maleylpyruvate isomerase family mycothiol-dependent enzyme [Mycobacterium sp. SM1]|uniref:maleylpyruvate isomerase family mycothiol-dependent enzyme n=1 Tax=Mycobacterium sp. SM1 TaxID=2816243 RepID=UPI001BCE4E23|nr:maleylpyruvate isomerase family mycothiol-dependent enzyme [Mycobacterium sp. SM1]MBS4727124.1 maleylpyruvate isomerase family mycothiol-dependent enzyme [Mycobacterium sp. SM1]
MAIRHGRVYSEPCQRDWCRRVSRSIPGAADRADASRYPTAGLASGFGGMIALVDGMIHQQDIRRPVGLPRTIPQQRLRVVLDYALTAPAVRGAKRARGIRLVATDLDWTHGNGPEVSGPGEALLMAMAARPDDLNQLFGPGKTPLAQRICR